MRKLFALYTNEMIKISRKISVIIILAIMIVGVVGLGGLMKFQESLNSNNQGNSHNNIGFQKDDMNRQLESQKGRLVDLQKKKESAAGAELKNLEMEERILKRDIERLQYAKDRDIVQYTSSYRSQAFDKLFAYKTIVDELGSIEEANLSEEQKKQLDNAKNMIPRLEKVIDNKDFKEFISLLNDEINKKDELSEDEKKIELQINELKLEKNLTGEINGQAVMYGNIDSYISQLRDDKRSLLHNIELSGGPQQQKPLTEEMREKKKDNIAVITYKIQKGIVNYDSNMGGVNIKDFVMPGMLGVGTFMLIILTMILAGGSVSQEISTGSIKSLIISPTKRWKIYIAKFLALLTVGVLGALILYTVAIIVNGVLFGTGASYVYAVNGVAHELNFYLYQFARLFSGFIEVIVYMVFAFMLSIITRNTAASVGISIAVTLVGSMANGFLLQFAKGEWLKFLPFNNLDFTTKLFPYDNLGNAGGMMTSGAGMIINNSLTFSLTYVVILVFCMGYIAFDSFTRRDIK